MEQVERCRHRLLRGRHRHLKNLDRLGQGLLLDLLDQQVLQLVGQALGQDRLGQAPVHLEPEQALEELASLGQQALEDQQAWLVAPDPGRNRLQNQNLVEPEW